MDVMITKMNGDSFKLSDYNIIVRDFVVGSIPVEGIYGTGEGRSGTINYGASYGTRTIEIPLYFKSGDYHGFVLTRDKLFEITTSKEPVYIREMRRVEHQTGGNKFVGGKRYLVRIVGEYSIEQMYRIGFGSLTFETVDLPFAESVGTSMGIHRNGANSGDGLWGFGMGLSSEDDTFIYKHEAVAGQRFRIFNAGSVPIHPFEQQLKITISNVVGSTEMFQVTNYINASRSRVNVPLSPSDVVEYDGANVTRNKLAFLRDTRKDFISLEPGWNEFEIFYCDSATIEFDFRYYYM